MSEFDELERELKRLQPRAVSADLAARIETALAQDVRATPTAGVLPRKPENRFRWFTLALGTAAAMGLLIAGFVRLDRTAAVQPTIAAYSTVAPQRQMGTETMGPQSAFVPDGLTRVVYHRRDEGLVYPRKSDSPVRRVRSRARETLQWKEPSTGASLRVSYPTEEVELIPVSGQ